MKNFFKKFTLRVPSELVLKELYHSKSFIFEIILTYVRQVKFYVNNCGGREYVKLCKNNSYLREYVIVRLKSLWLNKNCKTVGKGYE